MPRPSDLVAAPSSSTTNPADAPLGPSVAVTASTSAQLYSHYRCFEVIDSHTKSLLISDTVEFRHSLLHTPEASYEDRILHAINFLSTTIQDATNGAVNDQLIAIDNLRTIFNKWQLNTDMLNPPSAHHPATKAQPAPTPVPPVRPSPRVQQPPRVQHPPRVQPSVPSPTPSPVPSTQPSPSQPSEPIALRTRSRTIPVAPGLGQAIAHCTRSKVNMVLLAISAQALRTTLPTITDPTISERLAASVLDPESGLSLEYRQLVKHPKYKDVWSRSYAKELGRLCQGLKDTDSANKVTGTDTFHVIDFEDIPKDRLKEVCYSNVVCKVRPEKEDPNRTRITIAGTRVCYPGDVGTKTAPLELVKLMINSVLSRKGAKFCTFDISNFYLQTPLDRPEYIKVKLSDIPEEFIAQYNLRHRVHNDWVFFEIRKGIYGLPQSGILANNLLTKRLANRGYYQCETTPGLWRHKWRPILFTLIVDDFGIEYVGEQHARHLRDTIKEFYDITENWKGDLYAGINLAWNYSARTCRLSMNDYIDAVLTKYNHPRPQTPHPLAVQGSAYQLRCQGPIHRTRRHQCRARRRRHQTHPRHHWCSPLLCPCSRQQTPACPQRASHPTGCSHRSHSPSCQSSSRLLRYLPQRWYHLQSQRHDSSSPR